MTRNGRSGTIDGVRRFAALGAMAAVAFAVAAAEATAQDEPELGWFYNAELSAVFTGGNAVANTLGLGFGIRSLWEGTELNVRGRGIRTRTGIISRTAVGTTDDFVVNKPGCCC